MTIREAINRADTIRPNQYTDEIKIQWLSELDERIFNDIISTHEDNPYIDTIDEDGNTVKGIVFPYTDDSISLIAASPYDVLYSSYLVAMIDEANEETTRYTNSSIKYNVQYQDYAKWYNRNHLHI